MNRIKRIAAATVVGGITAGGVLLAGGVADAMPSDEPCGVSDVDISVAPDSSHAAGQEGYVITYTAATPTTNCKLQGTPTSVSFVAGGQHNAADVTVTPDQPGSAGQPVNVRAGHPAQSYVLQDAAAPVTFTPDALNLNLPTTNGYSTTVPWPSGAPLKGTSIRVTDVTPAAAATTARTSAAEPAAKTAPKQASTPSRSVVVAGILSLVR